MKKCIAIDMDCVMADLYDGFVAFEEKVSGKKIDRQAVRGVPIVKAFPSPVAICTRYRPGGCA